MKLFKGDIFISVLEIKFEKQFFYNPLNEILVSRGTFFEI